jgi:G3E family GTPase
MKIPVYIIHGSLGAGKTTILGKILSVPSFSKSLIIENEFADYNFDSGVVKKSGGEIEVKGISGGCICCSSSEELFTILEEAQESVPSVVIETSGVTNSMALIRKLLLSSMFNDKYQIVKNIMLVDLQSNPLQLEQKKLDLLLSDIVVLNKKDLSTLENISEFKLIVKKYTDAPCIEFDRNTPAENLLKYLADSGQSRSHENLKLALVQNDSKDHEVELMYQVLYPTKPIHPDSLLKVISEIDREGVRLLRVKGVFLDQEGKRTIINGTFGLIEFERSADAGELGIVFIGEGITCLSLKRVEELLN